MLSVRMFFSVGHNSHNQKHFIVDMKKEVFKEIAAFILFIAAACCVLYEFWPALCEVYQKCNSNDDYSHGLLLPFVAIILVWFKKEELQQSYQRAAKKPISFSWIGFVILLVGIFIDCFAQLTGQLLFIRWVAFFFFSVGLVFLSFGTKVGWLIVPPILLLFMARPIPESLVPLLFNPLQVIAAAIGAHALEYLNVPVYLRGNVIEVPGVTLLVEEACSGMRSVISMLTVACIISYYANLRFFGFLLISITAVVIAIVFNILRVTITGVLAHFIDPATATGFFHEFTGLVVFILGLLIMFSLTKSLLKHKWLIAREEK